MARMFLLKESLDNLNFQIFQSGLDELISIETFENDVFFKNNELNEINNYYTLYQDYSQENQFRAKYLEQLKTIESNPKTIEELNEVFINTICGFFGINFPQLNIDLQYCVDNNDTFQSFKKFSNSLISHSNFSILKEECFPKIIFCDKSEDQLISYGDGKYFKQCIDQFIVLQSYLQSWNEGNFQYQNLSETTAITISPESNTTMNQYKSERVFSLPNGGTGVFELHIKLGDIRIHILEDNSKKKIMIGYIGKHLTT